LWQSVAAKGAIGWDARAHSPRLPLARFIRSPVSLLIRCAAYTVHGKGLSAHQYVVRGVWYQLASGA
jgi:hypothetical protein